MIVDKHAAGRPAQFVLFTPEPAAVVEYYAALLGWTQSEQGTFALRGEPVARLAQGDDGWVPFIAVAGLDPLLTEVDAAGGAARGRLDGSLGSAVLVTDPTSTTLGLWESDSGPAARVWGEPGAVVWIEQKTRDQQAATEFLHAVFGYSFVGATGPGGVRVVMSDFPLFGGVMQVDDRWAADDPPHWLLYLQTDDVPAAVARGQEAGGTVWFPPFDTPLGTMTYLRDPAGNAFAVVEVSAGGTAMIHG